MFRRLAVRILALIILCVAFSGSSLALTPEDYDSNSPESLVQDELYAKSAILIDADSGEILLAKNENTRIHPASTTKIMTLLLGIESGIPLDSMIAIPQAASDIPRDSSLVPVFPGDTMKFGDLLLGFALSSGNDGANAVAVIVAGTVDEFVIRMNRRALDLGCYNTHFANPHGYTDSWHYTTAYDMALITREAMRNPTFREIVAQTRKTLQISDRSTIVSSKHLVMQSDSKYYYKNCIGIKSGTTDAAGNCFVGAAEKNGVTLISAVYNCSTDDERWLDTIHLFNYGWTCYNTYTLDKMYVSASDQIASIVISNAADSDPYGGVLGLDIAQLSTDEYRKMVQKDNLTAMQQAIREFIGNSEVSITHPLTAPVSQGEIMGDYIYRDPVSGLRVTAKLVASRSVEQKIVPISLTEVFPFLRLFSNPFFKALAGVLLILLILIIVLVETRKAARQRRRREILARRRREERQRGYADRQRYVVPRSDTERRTYNRDRNRDD